MCEGDLTQNVEMPQTGAAGCQLLYVWVADGAVGSEEELAQAWKAAGEVLETSRTALQRGTPAQVQFPQHPEQQQSQQVNWGDARTNLDIHRETMQCL